MIYLKCPTCGYILGNRQRLYDAGLNEIESNPNNDEETKLELKNKLVEFAAFTERAARMSRSSRLHRYLFRASALFVSSRSDRYCRRRVS